MGKEYGRKSYRNSGGYNQLMRTWTDKAVYDVQVQKHSEFKKPYKGQDYDEMENDFDSPGGTTPPITRPPNPDDPNWKPIIPGGGGGGFWDCWVEGCWCPGVTVNPIIKCIGGAQAGSVGTTFDGVGEGGSLSSSGGAFIEVPEGASQGTVKVTMGGPPSDNGYMDMCDECQQCQMTIETQGMQVNTTQQLGIEGACCGGKAYFKLESGGGKVTPSGWVQAPSTNDAGCTQNMHIGLYCNGYQVSEVTISINKSTNTTLTAAHGFISGTCSGRGSEPPSCECNATGGSYNCVGSLISTWGFWADTCSSNPEYCSYCVPGYCDEHPTCNEICADSGSNCSATVDPIDARTQQMKDEGCCPPQILSDYLGPL